jgi:hypothetical protein
MGYWTQKYKHKPLIISHLYAYASPGIYANP